MKTSISSSRSKRTKKPKAALPLFASWHAEAGLTPAAQRLARRFGLPPATAALLATLAGLGVNSEARTNG